MGPHFPCSKIGNLIQVITSTHNYAHMIFFYINLLAIVDIVDKYEGQDTEMLIHHHLTITMKCIKTRLNECIRNYISHSKLSVEKCQELMGMLNIKLFRMLLY